MVRERLNSKENVRLVSCKQVKAQNNGRLPSYGSTCTCRSNNNYLSLEHGGSTTKIYITHFSNNFNNYQSLERFEDEAAHIKLISRIFKIIVIHGRQCVEVRISVHGRQFSFLRPPLPLQLFHSKLKPLLFSKSYPEFLIHCLPHTSLSVSTPSTIHH